MRTSFSKSWVDKFKPTDEEKWEKMGGSLFLVISKKTKTGKAFKKIYKKGTHFGSRVLLEGGRRTGTITAKKDSLVLKIQGKSFKMLAENFPVLENYFGDYLPKTFKELKLNED